VTDPASTDYFFLDGKIAQGACKYFDASPKSEADAA